MKGPGDIIDTIKECIIEYAISMQLPGMLSLEVKGRETDWGIGILNREVAGEDNVQTIKHDSLDCIGLCSIDMRFTTVCGGSQRRGVGKRGHGNAR